MNGVWASSASNAFVVGQGGKILHYDGTAWRAESSGTDKDLYAVWGTAPDNVLAVGGTQGFNTGAYFGVILHYDGTTWALQSSPSLVLIRLWGSSPTDVYAVDVRGLLLHYDGANWTEQPNRPRGTTAAFWSLSASDIYAVGPPDSAWHFDGNGWTGQALNWLNSPPSDWVHGAYLYGVWASAADNVFAVGTTNTCFPGSCGRAVLARSCGGPWTAEVVQEPGLSAIWGSSAADIYAVGDSGVILRREGHGWMRQQAVTMKGLGDVWGTPDGALFVIGPGVILRGTR